MSGPRQRTISRETTLQGLGLHSGASTSVTFRGAEAGSGILFRRSDLEGEPEVPARVEHVRGTERGTTLGKGDATVRTVEHVLAAVAALRIDNLVIVVDGPEVPIRDGSFIDFLGALEDAAPVTQRAEAAVVRLAVPVTVGGRGGESYTASAGAGLRITASIEFEHSAIGRQSASFAIEPASFRAEIAEARTFGLKADADALRSRGLALGASLDNTVVLDEGGIMNDALRFQDEFVRHKIGDLVGDLALLGARLDAHIVADRPSHAGNVALVEAIAAKHRKSTRR